jgi:hypothetical protein
MTANAELIWNDLAYGRIKGGITSVATSIELYPGDIQLFLPQWSSGKNFYQTITDSQNNIEVVKVTGLTAKTNKLTVSRGQDSTNAREWYDGAVINHRINAALLTAMIQKEAPRQVAYDPNGILSPAYRGEKVYRTSGQWFKNVSGTVWQALTEEVLPFAWTEYDISALSISGLLNGCYDSDNDKYVLNNYGNEFNDQIESTDGGGTSWSLKNGSFAYGFRKSIYVPALGLYLAHHNYAFVDGPGFYSSPDAVTWTKRTATTGFSCYDMAYDPVSGVIIAVGDGAAGYLDIWRTTNGTSWTGYANPTTWGLNTVHYSSDLTLWIVAGYRIGIATSPDGITWTQRTPDSDGYDDTYEYFNSVASYDGTIIATGNIKSGNNWFQYSTDGINWNAAQTISGTNLAGGLTWCGNKWIVTQGMSLFYSEDGSTWTEDETVADFGKNLSSRFYNESYSSIILFDAASQSVIVGVVN